MPLVKSVTLRKNMGRSPVCGYQIHAVRQLYLEREPHRANAQRYFLYETFKNGGIGNDAICLPCDPDDLALVGRALLEIAYGPLSALAIEQEYKRDANREEN